jgi:hypothetical protein
MAYLVTSAQQWLGWQQLCNNQHKREEAKRRSSSQGEMAARQLNWQHQLRNGQGSSGDNNADNNDDNDAETTTMITTTTAAETIGINTGMDAAAALGKGLTTPGKPSQCQH